MKRSYLVDFNQHGHRAPHWWYQHEFTSNAKIGVVVRVLFRKWFGRSPDRCIWHKDGQFAGAEDRRGNYIFVTQLNGYDGFQQDLSRLALPWKGVAV